MILFKTEYNKNGWTKVNKELTDVVFEISVWLFSNYRKDLMITETFTTLEEDNAVNRESASHREGRAIDIRNNDWTSWMKEKFVTEFSKYDDRLGAKSLSDGIRRFIVDKPHGTGSHYHLQIGRDKIT